MAIPFSIAPARSTNWLSRAQTTTNGAPLPNLFNTLLALRSDPDWTGRIRYNDMLRTVILDDHRLTDTDVALTLEWLQANGLRRLGPDPVRQAIDVIAREHAFHPLRDWLDSLEWDGELRLTDWLKTYVGAEDNEYHRQIGCNFLKSMVARIYQPGCKADYMLVLYGKTRIQKSEICKTLASAEYFSDSLPDIGSDHVRVSMHLRGKWLIEVGELAAISSNRVDAARLKSFLSSPTEQYTPKFGRNEVVEPRQCLFAGTTNDKAFLRDATGNARFWTVVCGSIQNDALKRDREQLFAEAVSEYKRTHQWWPDYQFETDVIFPEQENHYDPDAWEDPVRAWLVGKFSVTLMEVADQALAFMPSRFSAADQRRLASVMRRLGWDLKRSATIRKWERV